MLLASTEGMEGQPALSDRVEDGSTAGQIVGWVIFDPHTLVYDSRDAFAADEHLHCVPEESMYAWQQGKTWLMDKREHE